MAENGANFFPYAREASVTLKCSQLFSVCPRSERAFLRAVSIAMIFMPFPRPNLCPATLGHHEHRVDEAFFFIQRTCVVSFPIA